jgi:hypothetical protein
LQKAKIEVATSPGEVKVVPRDIQRTGAKCVEGEAQDPFLPGVNWHTIGTLSAYNIGLWSILLDKEVRVDWNV